MTIIGIKPDHDGCIAMLSDGNLVWSIEHEKDSRARQSPMSFFGGMAAFEMVFTRPDVIALGGWTGVGVGYEGLVNIASRRGHFLGWQINHFSSSHERSHLIGAYAMSPYPQGAPCYILLWEGTFGRFYHVDELLTIRSFPTVLLHPGRRYSYLFYLAGGENSKKAWDWEEHNMSGKLMALGGFGQEAPHGPEESQLIRHLLNPELTTTQEVDKVLRVDRKAIGIDTPFLNIGYDSQRFRNLVHRYSNALFDQFYRFAVANLTEKLPLLIAGGCGLNCEWNSKWRNCGLFDGVFVPPCANDSGSAIGTAADAQYHFTGNAKINWSVYAGLAFVEDCMFPGDWTASDLDYSVVSNLLQKGAILPWVNGRYEIGPRALGNRSLLAEPFTEEMRDRLNNIKHREEYRPIAPVCLVEDAARHFDLEIESPYMLYFSRVKNAMLRAVTHVDNSARVQTVSMSSNKNLYLLLRAFKEQTGVGVLCNTSLNHRGRGFINRTSDLVRFCLENGIAQAVVNDKLFRRN